MITTTIAYDHHKTDKNKDGQIEIRVTANRKTSYIPTGIRVKRREFVAGRIVNRSDSDELNDRLNIIYKKVQQEINRCIDCKKIDIREIRRKAWYEAEEHDVSSQPFLDWFGEQLSFLALKDGTLKHYRTALKALEQFGKIKKWKDVNTENICLLDAWLHQRMSDSGAYNYHKCLKSMLNRAVLFGIIDNNPYIRLRGKFKRGDRASVEYLTEEEMKRFEETCPPVGTIMDKAHDLFIFQLYTGFSYSDTQTFSIDDYRLIDGQWRSVSERIKTGIPYISQLLPPVVKVLEKNGWKLPEMDNTTYNDCLKHLGKVACIAMPLHSHLARHTFATYMLRHNVPIENVSKMLGHSNIVHTQRYAKVMAASVHEDFTRISELLTKQKEK